MVWTTSGVFGVPSGLSVHSGGDFYYGRGTDGGPFGLVLSTWPSDVGCGRSVTEGAARYCYLQGTSMASPHAAGVAALIVSQFGTPDAAHGGLTMSPAAVRAKLRDSATNQPCPTPATVDYTVVGRPASFNATCEGSLEYNGFYGDGIVNALAAVSGRR